MCLFVYCFDIYNLIIINFHDLFTFKLSKGFVKNCTRVKEIFFLVTIIIERKSEKYLALFFFRIAQSIVILRLKFPTSNTIS